MKALIDAYNRAMQLTLEISIFHKDSSGRFHIFSVTLLPPGGAQ